jgi:hypothetical protein
MALVALEGRAAFGSRRQNRAARGLAQTPENGLGGRNVGARVRIAGNECFALAGRISAFLALMRLASQS